MLVFAAKLRGATVQYRILYKIIRAGGFIRMVKLHWMARIFWQSMWGFSGSCATLFYQPELF